MKDPDDIIVYKHSVKRLKVHIFLAGLDSDFEQIRGEILRREQLPDLEGCYSLIRREVVQQATLKGKSKDEGSTMIAKNRSFQNTQE